MTIQEFSDTFDTLLNSHNVQAQFGEQASKTEIVLDEYEKSVLLTQAQDLIVKSYFDRKSNSAGEGFDDSERRQVDFSSLIETYIPTQESVQTKRFDDRGILYRLPSNILFILNEYYQVTKDDTYNKRFVVIPINYKEYDREMSKAYAQPLKKQAWRLFQNLSTGYELTSEIILNKAIYDKVQNGYTGTYHIRYVKRPTPIILVDLPNDLEIEGNTSAMECSLNPILHTDILNKAVELAIATRGGGIPQRPNEGAG